MAITDTQPISYEAIPAPQLHLVETTVAEIEGIAEVIDFNRETETYSAPQLAVVGIEKTILEAKKEADMELEAVAFQHQEKIGYTQSGRVTHKMAGKGLTEVDWKKITNGVGICP
jgi:hypothetical protein